MRKLNFFPLEALCRILSSVLETARQANPRFILLDRDGVLNRKVPEGSYICAPSDLELLPGAGEAIRLLNNKGIVTIVLTNQRGIARGVLSEPELEQIHLALRLELSKYQAHIDAIYYCPHDQGQCNCRKPRTGLIEKAFEDFPLASRENTLMIGDSLADIQAGRTFGIRTVFIKGTEQERRKASAKAALLANTQASSLLEAVKQILAPNCPL